MANDARKVLRAAEIILITGTDTGVGKTLFTASWLRYLRQKTTDAIAMKPFCSGGRGDVEILQTLQPEARLPDAIVNPYYFEAPVSPLAAARRQRRALSLRDTLARIRALARGRECLLVEGAGGLLSPLGPGIDAAKLIARLRCRVVVVARNQIGTINQTLLTARALPSASTFTPIVVLMETANPDPSAASNPAILREIMPNLAVFRFPYLGPNASHPEAVIRHSKQLKPFFRNLLSRAGFDQTSSLV